MSNKTDFKVGDKVVCVDNIGEESLLPLLKQYTISEEYKNSIALSGVKGLWSKSRFKLSESTESKAYEKQSEAFEKPKQYQIGIDTFKRSESNQTLSERLAVARFLIDKYTWRKKDQEREDFVKIADYANWAVKQIDNQ